MDATETTNEADGSSNAATKSSANANSTARSNTNTAASSEDCLIFGSTPSHLFDSIAITIDNLLTNEVATLPLLPRSLSDNDHHNHDNDEANTTNPLTGEEKLLGKLRKAYKKNLDLAEAYCSRNIFTIAYHSKSKRRKILEQILAHEQQDTNHGITEKEDDGHGTNSNKLSSSHPDNGANVTNDATSSIPSLPTTKFDPPPPNSKLPTPEQITAMDKEILLSRQRLHHEKQRRVKLSRQLDQLTNASRSLEGVQDALQKGLLNTTTNDDGDALGRIAMEIRESITNAMQGHTELKMWNTRAEEVIQILDKIKEERGGDNGGIGNTNGGGSEGGSHMSGKMKGRGIKRSNMAVREEDERERRKMMAEMGGGIAKSQHGTKEEINSVLKKLRGE